MKDAKEIILNFPLRGEWVAPHTPADKVPSHGTDILGQRYAFDFYRTIPEKKNLFFKGSLLKYFICGIQIVDCLCYKEKIYSPVDGKVVVVKDGIKEPRRLHPILDLIKVFIRSISILFQSLFFDENKINLHKYIGNYVIIEFVKVFVFFAHISPGTIQVKEGQIIKKGEFIGLVGHTGNSTAPHLHFHIMDSENLFKAKGIPCIFTKYEILDNGRWRKIENSIPTSNQRIRLI